jgi:hypothetical protein
MKSNGKFTYTSYDYSFLRPKPSFWESKVLPIVERAYAKTIGADLTTIKPMSEPSGQLFWLDTSFTAAAEPDNTASATTTATTNDSISAVATRILDASNAIAEKSSKGKANYMIVNPSIFYDYDFSGHRKKLREERTREYFKRKNYFKKIRNR